MANYPIYRLVKGSTLTFTEMDDNLEWLSKNLSGSQVIISGSTSLTGSLFAEGPVIISGSLANGINAAAIGVYSHAEGDTTQAIGNYSHTEGSNTYASGFYSHAEGSYSSASQDYSHAEGGYTLASGFYSHAEGNSTTAIGNSSHAEGAGAISFEEYSHAEGYNSVSSGSYSHAEGYNTIARGISSHAEGRSTIASGPYSHTEGLATVASGNYQHVQGQYNISSSAQSAFIIGNGVDDTKRSNLVFASGSSFQITGSLGLSGSITASNALFTGTITAQTLVVQTITSSTEWITGSSKFGSLPTDTHQFTGSVLAPSITGSLLGTSSWAISSSYTSNIYNSDGFLTSNRQLNLKLNILNIRYSGSWGSNLSAGTTASFKVSSNDNSNALAVYENSSVTIGQNAVPAANFALIVNGSNNAGISTTGIAATQGGSFGTYVKIGDSFSTYGVFFTTGVWNGAVGIADADNSPITGVKANEIFLRSSTSYTDYNNVVLAGTLGVGLRMFGRTLNVGISQSLDNGYKFQVNGVNAASGSLWVSGSSVISGSLIVTQGITGSLFGTSSWSQNSVTSSNFNGTGSDGFVSNMSDTYTGTAKIKDIVTLSAAEYAAIGAPLTSTLYVVI